MGRERSLFSNSGAEGEFPVRFREVRADLPRTVLRCFILVSLLGSAACSSTFKASTSSSAPRSTIALPWRGAENAPIEGIDSPADEVLGAPSPTSRSRRFEIESAALTRAFGRPRTVGADVLLPVGFRPDAELAIAYHVPDLGDDPARLAEHLADLDLPDGLVVVVLDPRGIHGHHLFTDSVNEGPHGEALVTDLIPVLEQHLFAGGSPRRRCVVGVGLGGWTAIHLQVDYPHAFDAAFAVEPDPLDLRAFYGADLSSSEATAKNGAPARRLRVLRDEGLAGRLTSFESALGARGDDGLPLALFSGAGGNVDAAVIAGFARRDPATIVRERGKTLAPRLGGKIYAAARSGDGLGRDVSLRSFAVELETAGIRSSIRTPDVLDVDQSVVGAWAAMLLPPRP